MRGPRSFRAPTSPSAVCPTTLHDEEPDKPVRAARLVLNVINRGGRRPPVEGSGSSAVEVAAAAPAVRLGPEQPLQLRQAPDPGAIGANVRLDLGGQLTDGGQVDTEEFGALLQRRWDRPAQVRVMPGPYGR